MYSVEGKLRVERNLPRRDGVKPVGKFDSMTERELRESGGGRRGLGGR